MRPDITRRGMAALAAALIAFPAALPAEGDHSQGSPRRREDRVPLRRAGKPELSEWHRYRLRILNRSGRIERSPASLFHGPPSEATALLTFRANINFQPLPGNGPIGNGQFAVTPILVTPGDFQIYFTPSPDPRLGRSHYFLQRAGGRDPGKSTGAILRARDLRLKRRLSGSPSKRPVFLEWTQYEPPQHLSQRRDQYHLRSCDYADRQHTHRAHFRLRRLRSHDRRLIAASEIQSASPENVDVRIAQSETRPGVG